MYLANNFNLTDHPSGQDNLTTSIKKEPPQPFPVLGFKKPKMTSERTIYKKEKEYNKKGKSIPLSSKGGYSNDKTHTPPSPTQDNNILNVLKSTLENNNRHHGQKKHRRDII